jgi:hypothetical protein
VQIGKISGTVDTVVVPRTNDASMEVQIEEAKALAMERCICAGGSRATLEVVEVELIPISYVTDGSTRLIVRVVADLLESQEEPEAFDTSLQEPWAKKLDSCTNCDSKATSYDVAHQLDVAGYRPRIEGDLWYLSETDLQFLQDGTGVLGVGSCGDAYPSYVACLGTLARGEDITIRRQDSIADDAIVLIAGFMVGAMQILLVLRG